MKEWIKQVYLGILKYRATPNVLYIHRSISSRTMEEEFILSQTAGGMKLQHFIYLKALDKI